MQTKHLSQALEALRTEEAGPDDEALYVPRTIDVACGSFTIFERTVHRQSAASFAHQHRILPSTDVTGLRLWPCSLDLLDHLVTAPAVLPQLAARTGRPLTVVELGAGVGIVGLGIAAALGPAASAVVVTDPEVPIAGGGTSLSLLARTVAANAARCPSVVARRLLWGDAADLAALRASHPSCDVVIGCELLYREDSVEALVQSVATLEPALVVLAQRTRPSGSFAIERACAELMQAAGYAAASPVPVAGTPGMIYTFERVSPGAADSDWVVVPGAADI